jgi:hypothetical protein
VASLTQGRTVAVQCGLFTRKTVPVIFEPPCIHIRVHGLFIHVPAIKHPPQEDIGKKDYKLTHQICVCSVRCKYSLTRVDSLEHL